jgi:predicted hydrolase (HD superfamily)
MKTLLLNNGSRRTQLEEKRLSRGRTAANIHCRQTQKHGDRDERAFVPAGLLHTIDYRRIRSKSHKKLQIALMTKTEYLGTPGKVQ